MGRVGQALHLAYTQTVVALGNVVEMFANDAATLANVASLVNFCQEMLQYAATIELQKSMPIGRERAKFQLIFAITKLENKNKSQHLPNSSPLPTRRAGFTPPSPCFHGEKTPGIPFLLRTLDLPCWLRASEVRERRLLAVRRRRGPRTLRLLYWS